MTHPLPALQLLRRVCEDVRGTLDDERAIALDRAAILLTRLIVEERTGEPGVDDDDPVAADLAWWEDFDAEMRAELGRRAEPAAADSAETFDQEAVADFLRRSFPDEEAISVVSASVAARGFSKKTMLLRLEGARRLPGELALRIDQPFNYLGTTVVDEYPVIRHLWSNGVRLPEPLVLEPSGAVLGQPFIVFPRVAGGLVGSNFDSPPRNPTLIADIAACLAGLHAVPVGEFARRDGKPHLDEEIDRVFADWSALGVRSPLIERAFDWVKVHRSLGLGPVSFVHNDYNFNNMLVEGDRVRAIVDWEFVHVGTPAADLSYFYYSAEATSSFDHFLSAYAVAGGQVPSRETLEFYILWGQLRLAVMGFQVETGFRQGKFDDIRFGLAGALYLRQSMLRVGRKLQELIARGEG
ncbi:phosphotransferase family protein [Sphingosinicella terrae]|uniref:phosphotransferase family protein n=1 Tax=Sphingosinicella terrae TaxID=2172047 RepID=UPI000E0D01BF|nr:phosphotransferase family protein [Sphingosinicella terrae]